MRPPPFTPRPWTDADGVVGWSEPKTLPETDCAVCGRTCGVQVAGVVIHLPCWERSTEAARSRRPTPNLTRPAPPQPAPQPATPSPRTAQQPATRPATTGGTAPAAAAAVVDLDGVWRSDGQHLPLPESLTHVGDLVHLAQQLRLGTQITPYLTGSGQVWLGDGLAAQLGIDVAAIRSAPASKREQVARESTASCPAVTEALVAGFRLGGSGDGLGKWTRVSVASDKPVWVVLLAAEEHGDGAIPLLAGEPDHATLARRVGLLATELRAPYALSASTTGLDLMISLRWKDRGRFFPVREAFGPAQIPTIESDLNWTRRPSAEESAQQWVHAYDRSGSYLAGVSGLDLGVGDPVHHPEGRPFEKVPGYWRIEVPETGDVRLPNPLDPNGSHAGRTRWVTTPTLQLALELEYDPVVVEAWTWPEKARVLDPWYDRIRDARTALDLPDADAQAARDQLKMIYATTIGMLGSELHMKDREGYAPDRRHHIIAKSRANILRRVDKIGRTTGRWPVAILADSVLYTSDEADPVAAWPGEAQWLGRELGRYKVEGSAPLVDQLQYLTGGIYRGKDALTEDA